jgi:hydroxypyruvate isomerase
MEPYTRRQALATGTAVVLGGMSGRHELDETPEVAWRAVATAIADMPFDGYLAHEFVPTRDPLTSLREAVVLCDV